MSETQWEVADHFINRQQIDYNHIFSSFDYLSRVVCAFYFQESGGKGAGGTSGKNANLMNSSSGILIGKSISKNVPSCRELLPSPTTIAEPRSCLLKPKTTALSSGGAQPHLSSEGDSSHRSWVTTVDLQRHSASRRHAYLEIYSFYCFSY